MEPLFGYPTLIRFSWATTDNMLEDMNAYVVAWYRKHLLNVGISSPHRATGKLTQEIMAKAKRE